MFLTLRIVFLKFVRFTRGKLNKTHTRIMSRSLLKRSLQLFEEDFDFGKEKANKKNEKANQKKKSIEKSSIMELIPENQRLTTTTRDRKTKEKRKQSLIWKQNKPIIVYFFR